MVHSPSPSRGWGQAGRRTPLRLSSRTAGSLQQRDRAMPWPHAGGRARSVTRRHGGPPADGPWSHRCAAGESGSCLGRAGMLGLVWACGGCPRSTLLSFKLADSDMWRPWRRSFWVLLELPACRAASKMAGGFWLRLPAGGKPLHANLGMLCRNKLGSDSWETGTHLRRSLEQAPMGQSLVLVGVQSTKACEKKTLLHLLLHWL